MDYRYLTDYYNKFNEDKRLKSRHGQIEFINTCRYIDDIIEAIKIENRISNEEIKLLDIGAGTGAYSGRFSNMGIDTYAIELVKHNCSRLKVNFPNVKARVGNALDLKKYEDDFFDICLLFGPMYHLFEEADKVKCLKEAKRVTKPGGYIFVAYVMNEYAIYMYAFKEHNMEQLVKDNRFRDDYRTVSSEKDLYDYVRTEDIDRYNELADLKRDFIFTPDGGANYMRETLKEMSENEFMMLVDYQYCVAKRTDLLGAGAHVVDVLRKKG